MIKRPKIAIVGAGGNVGAAVAQWAAQKELGDLVLIDIKAGPAEGRALDLTQCGPWEGFNNTSFVATDKSEAMEGADVVVMTAGVPRKPGQSREELININAGIVKGICGDVKKYAPNSVLIVVSNPLDAMVFVAKQVTGFPRERVIGMAGVLDSARFRAFIADELKVSVENVTAFVLGGHGDTMVPLPRYSTVAGIPITELIEKSRLEALVQRTRDGGAEIVKYLKTGSAYYAPSAAATEMVEAILKDKKKILPCAAYLQGEYGISGLYVGVPVKLGAKGIEQIIEIKLTAEEKAGLDKSAAAVKELCGVIGV